MVEIMEGKTAGLDRWSTGVEVLGAGGGGEGVIDDGATTLVLLPFVNRGIIPPEVGIEAATEEAGVIASVIGAITTGA